MRVFALAILLLPWPAGAQELTSDASAVRLEVGDVRRLAQIVRVHSSSSDLTSALEREYFGQASIGLRAYASVYDVTARSLSESVTRNPRLYADLDALADAVLAHAPTIRDGLQRLTGLFPKAMFPPVWFVIGHNGPGGLTRQEGVLIAIERYVDSPGDVVPLRSVRTASVALGCSSSTRKGANLAA